MQTAAVLEMCALQKTQIKSKTAKEWDGWLSIFKNVKIIILPGVGDTVCLL